MSGSRPTEISAEWRARAKQADLIEAAWSPALKNPALATRVDALARIAGDLGAADVAGDASAVRAHRARFVRELKVLTEITAEVAPALVTAFGERAVLARVLAAHALLRMRELLGIETTTEDLQRINERLSPMGPLVPTPRAFADLHAALGIKRKRGRPPGAVSLGEDRVEIESAIRKAIRELLPRHARPTKTAIANTWGRNRSGKNVLERALRRWSIDLDALIDSEIAQRKGRKPPR